jgi:hypothetical protein
MKYRGIENLYANIWQLIDGINFNSVSNQAYIARNAKQYMSSVFIAPYTALGYLTTNTPSDNYILKMGYDTNNPFIQLPIEVGILGNSKYKDTFTKVSGGEIIYYGGAWHNLSIDGISTWAMDASGTIINNLNVSTRLVKTPS